MSVGAGRHVSQPQAGAGFGANGDARRPRRRTPRPPPRPLKSHAPRIVPVNRANAWERSWSCDRLRPDPHGVQALVDDRVNEAVDTVVAEPGRVAGPYLQ